MANDRPRPPGRVPLRARTLYAAQSLPTNAISQAWSLWLIFFYAPPPDADLATRVPGLGPIDPRVLLGIVLTATRVLEALDDPAIGYWSDRTRSRWGRRVPFVVLGTPLWALLFVMLFTPPGGGDAPINLVYLFFVAIAFYLMSNLAGAPLEALLPQIARHDDDRVSIASWQVIFGVLGAVVGLSLSSLLRQFFGFVVMAIAIAVIALGVRYIALAGAWAYAISDDQPSKQGLRRAVRETFSNKQFLAFLPSFVLFQVALHLLISVLPFYVETVLTGASIFGFSAGEESGIFTFFLTALVIGGMVAAVPFFNRAARRYGKATVYRAAMLGSAFYFPVLFLVGLLPGVPLSVQGLLLVFLAGIPMTGVFLFPSIITADIVDYDETRTETRREAMFYGAQNLLEKMATAFAPLIFALVLLAGDSRDNPLGVRLVGPVAGAVVLLGYIGFRYYTLPGRVTEEGSAPAQA
jgi:GPH family glycoside/pentoside/hexuronide:cation symporter